MIENRLNVEIFMQPIYRGKVRDIYQIGEYLFMVASDRISAFDCVFFETVPDKGKILTNISNHWFQYFKDIPNHIVETRFEKFPDNCRSPKFDGNSVLVKKCKRIDYECIVRGYISGSAWKEYSSKKTIAGIPYSSNLLESEKLIEPLFTPSIKNDKGHDINISEKEMQDDIGNESFQILKETSMKIFLEASAICQDLGIILCDTKFEFGVLDNQILLIDELLTPDSSRYWDISQYSIGSSPPSYDKQILRNYLEESGWNKEPPPPELPVNILKLLSKRYKEFEEKIVKCLSAK
jgi:phosphoribosylaminoimidazole-succinocarboxamide synthase